MPNEKRESTKVPIPLKTLEHELGLDQPRKAPRPDDDTPTSPDLLDGICRACRGEPEKRRNCAVCRGSGLEP